jgi:hypothetical protein
LDGLVVRGGGNSLSVDLWSSEYYEQKAWKRVQSASALDFLPWEEAREKYIKTRIEPELTRYRQSDHDWFKDFNRRRGEMMHSSDVIFRLQKLNPHIFVQQQINFPDDWGLYTSALGRIQFLTGLPKGWLSEFSYALVDDRDLPVEERRGWRTIIIYCLMKGAVTWEQVLAEFGEPQDGFNEQRWCETTVDFRLGGDQLFQRNIRNVLES